MAPDLVKIATEAAEAFVSNYYPALTTPPTSSTSSTFSFSRPSPSPVSAFYVPPTPPSDDHPHALPHLLLNGAVSNTPPGPLPADTTIEVAALDAHVLNPAFPIAPAVAAELPPGAPRMSLVVVVSGTVRYGGSSSPTRAFSESFVMVPNLEAVGKKGSKGRRQFLIQSQEFRVVV